MTNKKKHLIDKLIKCSGSRSTLDKMIDSQLKFYRELYGQGLKEEELNDVFEDFNTENVINSIIPVYDEEFSEEEIQELISFYCSKVGKKLISTEFNRKQEIAMNKIINSVQEKINNYIPTEK